MFNEKMKNGVLRTDLIPRTVDEHEHQQIISHLTALYMIYFGDKMRGEDETESEYGGRVFTNIKSAYQELDDVIIIPLRHLVDGFWNMGPARR